MALVCKGVNKLPYYYKTIREGKKFRCEYIARGEVAMELARQDADTRAARDARQRAIEAEILGLDKFHQEIYRPFKHIDESFNQAMQYCGFEFHHRHWRQRPSMNHFDPKSKVYRDARKAEDARRLFENADDVPAVIEKLGGNLGKRLRERLITKLSTDHKIREAIRNEAELMRRDLEGENPTVIERLVVERIVVAWLGLAWLDRMDDAWSSELDFREVAAHVTKMRNTANRNYLHSIKCLALIRNAAPVLMVNLNTTVEVRKEVRKAKSTVGRLEALGAGLN